MSQIDEIAAKWAVLQFGNKITPKDEIAFQEWYNSDIRHQGAFLRAEAALNLVSSYDTNIDLNEEIEEKPKRRAFIQGAIAASALVGGLFAFQNYTNHKIKTIKGELRELPLADKSIVKLNTDTELDIAYNNKTRGIKLIKGEAWFKVAHNKEVPFIVDTSEVKIRAVGTAFSVRKFATGVQVNVTEGKVAIWNTNNKTIYAQKGTSVFMPNNSEPIIESSDNIVDKNTAWRTNQIILNEDTISYAVAEFNRYNNKQIILIGDELKSKKIVGGFNVHDIENFAHAMQVTFNTNLTINEKEIILSK